MPFTPFHFGPALLVKSIAPRWFSLSAFVASQVVIDIETLYWLWRGDWPVHRVLHTFLGGTVVGIAVAVAVTLVARSFASLAAEGQFRPAFVGGLIGGLSHSLLDGIMHADIRPFRPITAANPLLGLMDVGDLHLGCVAAGVLGLIALLIRRPWKRAG